MELKERNAESRKLAKVLALALALVMALAVAACGGGNNAATTAATAAPATTAAAAATTAAPAGGAADALTFGVLIYKYDDTYISTVRSAIEKYAGENPAISLDMQDGQGDQAKQNDQLDVLIQKGVDVLVINAVDAGSAQGLADKAKAAGIPAVFFNREPDKTVMESCGGIFIGTTASEAGVMQGDLLADMWTDGYDRNGDGKVQFVVFKGEPGNPEAEARTSYSQSQAEDRGLVMDNVNGDPLVANWATDQAQSQMEAVLAAHSDIEAVFANNDDMALGVIAALNSVGYNTGTDDAMWIPVIGVDATDAGVEAINQGKMAATVKQDGDAMGKAIVAIATNAAQGADFLAGTEYKIADDGVSVRIPYAPNKMQSTPTGGGGASASAGPLTFGVLIYKYDDTYISTVRAAIEKYAGENAAAITLDMQDGQGDQAKQNDQLDVLIQKGVDVLVINAVDAGSAQGLADKAVAAGIPAVFFNREPAKSVMESSKSIFIGTTASEAGVMQGDLLADLWAAKPEYDRNGDGKVQFVVFKGEPGNPEAEARTSFAQSQAEARGLVLDNVNGEPLVANWATDQAQSQMEAVLAAHSDVEAVFANNDDMALGVIAALNSVGYNTDASAANWIPVIGVDATDAGLEAIAQGKMAATVKQDGDAMGKAIVAIAANAAQGADYLAGTDYKMADDGVSVRIPYAPMQ
ncbi:MAG: galactose ABC transporter substrate-binding protein [Clostridiales bacterium]|jgi:methyl-galactoside transport system substrate-binding protein|nr:galactose ABC transporter substrate-binding protein [Clostridiales bacterium]